MCRRKSRLPRKLPSGGDPAEVRLTVTAHDEEFKPLDNATVQLTVRPVRLASSENDPDQLTWDTNYVQLTAEPSATIPGKYEATYIARKPELIPSRRWSRGPMAGRRTGCGRLDIRSGGGGISFIKTKSRVAGSNCQADWRRSCEAGRFGKICPATSRTPRAHHRNVDGPVVAESRGFSVCAGLLCGGVGNPPLERIAVKSKDFLSRLEAAGLIGFSLCCLSFPIQHRPNQRTTHARPGHRRGGRTRIRRTISAWADLWKQAAAKGGLQTSVIGEDTNNPENDRTRLLTVLTNEVAKPAGELWLVFIGHGTFDGRSAKFNLRGPDISADDLASGVETMPTSAGGH
jgi:hypothetical protein